MKNSSPGNPHAAVSSGAHRTPFGVTILLLGVLTVALLNLLRLAQSLQSWQILAELLPLSPLYFAISGGFWGMFGLALAWGIWHNARWAPWAVRLGSLAYAAYVWVDRLWLQKRAGGGENWPFAAGLTLFLLVLIFWLLSWRKVRVFFGEAHDS